MPGMTSHKSDEESRTDLNWKEIIEIRSRKVSDRLSDISTHVFGDVRRPR